MLDIPADMYAQTPTEIHLTVTDIPSYEERGFFVDSDTRELSKVNDPLLLKAKAIVDHLGDKFNWEDIVFIIRHDGVPINGDKLKVDDGGANESSSVRCGAPVASFVLLRG